MYTQPFFSIGITTYNRIDLLRHSIKSLLDQEFKDFEILIGNDFVQEPLTLEKLGINDNRIKIHNNTTNLGEIGNMNMLLLQATGSYFTWQFDDDLCSPDFLIEAYKALTKFGYPYCLYTALGHIYGKTGFKFSRPKDTTVHLYKGPGFLRAFLSGKHKIMGTAGLYKSDYLKSIGGVTRLSSGNMAVYSEYLMIFKACHHSDIAFIDARLVAFRVHETSWSGSTAEAMLYKEAGINLLRASIPIFSDQQFIIDYSKNLTSLLRSIISMVITKNRLAGIANSKDEVDDYYMRIASEFNSLDPELKKKSVECLSSTKNFIFLFKAKAFLKKHISLNYLKYVHKLSSIISPILNKSF